MQVIWLAMLEVPAYTISSYVVGLIGGLDAGGSITIHAFGAYYGLAASYWLSFPASGVKHAKNGASLSVWVALGCMGCGMSLPPLSACLVEPDACLLLLLLCWHASKLTACVPARRVLHQRRLCGSGHQCALLLVSCAWVQQLGAACNRLML